jgi:hypothetical protein
MRAIHGFIVEPIDGKRYDNEVDFGGVKFIVSSSIEDHKVTQRHAKLIATPRGYKGDMRPGDTVIVHHNTFRKSYDMKGKEVSGGCRIRDNLYVVDETLLYMYKNESGWNAISPFIFVSPIENDHSMFDNSVYKQRWGRVEFSPTDEYKKGDLVSFQPYSEYEFRIDDKLMYRMFLRNITLIESNHGAEEINNGIKAGAM